MSRTSWGTLEVFSTCPQSKSASPERYARQVIDVARWSEAAGCRGILVYADNGLVDPWLVSALIIQHTTTLAPLVALQPVYMHPYSAAKMVASLAFLYGRRVYLNLLAGGFKNDLLALGDETPHDARYERMVEYARIVMELLAGASPVTIAGRHYAVHNLRLSPPVPEALLPGLLVSGSSDAGVAAARALGATAVRYPKPAGAEAEPARDDALRWGIRVGIIARAHREEAWRVGHERFPDDRQGQLTHQLSMKVSDSQWHAQLSQLGTQLEGASPYWLGPFQRYQTFCPYLVGSYDDVAEELSRYTALGARTLILDIPATAEELHHIGVVLEAVAARRAHDPATAALPV